MINIHKFVYKIVNSISIIRKIILHIERQMLSDRSVIKCNIIISLFYLDKLSQIKSHSKITCLPLAY